MNILFIYICINSVNLCIDLSSTFVFKIYLHMTILIRYLFLFKSWFYCLHRYYNISLFQSAYLCLWKINIFGHTLCFKISLWRNFSRVSLDNCLGFSFSFIAFAGKCFCFQNRTGVDCSISTLEPPVVLSLKGGELCDTLLTDCTMLVIYGKNFVDNENLTCHFTEIKVRYDRCVCVYHKGLKNELINVLNNRKINGWIAEWTDGWMDGMEWTNEWMGSWMDG